ncbi:hypothetical protein O181_105985 [Austropuccinia psidii MF-1]|uniref:CCHC-type domain-containing protein n=1 Tax=Austropuccinia psidii MF-1 TaxID=1389203 RepID=A0A9Q3PM73_9BASI|nr:hypothetical protein [Austropuccinia psidii MF-1]
MSYSEKEALKQLPEASSCPKFLGTGEYDHMELIHYIDRLFIHVSSIPDYWITARLNTEFKGHASIWYTEMKEAMAEEAGHGGVVQSSKGTAMEKNIQKYSQYKSSGFREKQPLREELKDKPRERVAEVTNKKNPCSNCGSTNHYANNCPKAKKQVYAIEKFLEDSESDSMGDTIREKSDEGQVLREEFLVAYQEETPLEIQDIQLEAGMPQDHCKQKLV